MATYRTDTNILVTIWRHGGPRRGFWTYTIHRDGIVAEGKFPCRDGGNFRATYLAARKALEDLYRQWEFPLPLKLYPCRA